MKILGKNSDLNKVNFKLSINKQKLMVKYRPQNRKFNNLPRTRTFIKSMIKILDVASSVVDFNRKPIRLQPKFFYPVEFRFKNAPYIGIFDF